jgi:putative flippase GtrA
MQRSSAFADRGTIERARRALGQRHNWLQLGKFCAVGASGYLVNLLVFSVLVGAGLHYLLAATGSFLVAVTNNYIWNRQWTFRGQRGHVAYQGLRFLLVSAISLCANLVILHVLVQAMDREVLPQAIAIVLVTPLNFVGNKLWSFGLR